MCNGNRNNENYNFVSIVQFSFLLAEERCFKWVLPGPLLSYFALDNNPFFTSRYNQYRGAGKPVRTEKCKSGAPMGGKRADTGIFAEGVTN